MVAAALAGVLVWLLVQQFTPVFGPTSEGGPATTEMPPTAQLSASHGIKYGNTAVVYGLFGGIVAAFFAVAEGAARRSAGYAVVGVLLGLLSGAVFGALGAGAGRFIETTEPSVERMVKTMMMHAAGWSITGLGVGLGFTIASWRGKTIGLAVLGGVVAGGVSGLLFPILAGLLFTGSNTDQIVPAGSGARLFWFVLTASLMAIVVGGLRGTRPRRARQPAPATSA
ncbi:MAG: hypothetical protein WD847_11980 [Pirellulales bacterium]